MKRFQLIVRSRNVVCCGCNNRFNCNYKEWEAFIVWNWYRKIVLIRFSHGLDDAINVDIGNTRTDPTNQPTLYQLTWTGSKWDCRRVFYELILLMLLNKVINLSHTLRVWWISSKRRNASAQRWMESSVEVVHRIAAPNLLLFRLTFAIGRQKIFLHQNYLLYWVVHDLNSLHIRTWFYGMRRFYSKFKKSKSERESWEMNDEFIFGVGAACHINSLI